MLSRTSKVEMLGRSKAVETTHRKVLVTGGGGFIGTHLVDALLARGDEVRVLDNLDPETHGADARRPRWLSGECDLIVGDVRDPEQLRRALHGVDAVVHLAAAVGAGRSMVEVADFTATNALGTAHLLQALLDERKELHRLVVAGSMCVYGEGRYLRPDGAQPVTRRRTGEQLRRHRWELTDPDGTVLLPRPTDERKELDLRSVYAIGKATQEAMVLRVGEAHGISSVALRLFNVYGPRQLPSNPYTGVVTGFASRLASGQPPLVLEDGHQTRDLVSVHDAVQGILLSLDEEGAAGKIMNIGSGQATSVLQVAETLAQALGTQLSPRITGQYRVGDARHCFADVSAARQAIGFAPRVSVTEGLREYAGWLAKHPALPEVGEPHAA
jgi:dTDP-L-rhamnose 4-epimerase